MYCFVLHIGIQLHCANNKETHKFCLLSTCKFYLILYLHVESKHRTGASLCSMYNIAVFQYVIQNSTFTRQNTLHFIILEIIPMYTLVSDVHDCVKAKIVQLSSKPDKSVGRASDSDLRVVCSHPTVDKNFSFCISSLSTRSWQVY